MSIRTKSPLKKKNWKMRVQVMRATIVWQMVTSPLFQILVSCLKCHPVDTRYSLKEQAPQSGLRR
eukprot:TRINITY_DN10603_c0_g1_i1.p2 TRINITY_DN10603_c0_g1~~TRINITY_DN10603_c0_g1_i1.p2  ORF type:complete len:65 (+),score=11.94 TRINITY_DN10603_c0_g1_i1:300-494(+)